MSVVNASALLASSAGGGDYQISRSVRTRGSASAYFSRTPGVAGNRRTWTWSGWVKRASLLVSQPLLAAGTSDTARTVAFWGDAELYVFHRVGATITGVNTTAAYRDTSAWYHVVIAADTTQAVTADRVKIYINGVQQTTVTYVAAIAQNTDFYVNATNQHAINGQPFGSAFYGDGYFSEVNFVDGQALTPASFGETDLTTGVWKPKRYAGTYGTNGFYLDFSDNSAATATALGKDRAGSNNWTPTGISLTAGATYDSMLDVPSQWADGGNGRGNYATLNPLSAAGQTSFTLSDGNLAYTLGGAATHRQALSTHTIEAASYFEVTIGAATTNYIGVTSVADSYVNNYVGFTANSYAYASNGQKINASTAASYGASYTTGDVIGVAFDPSTGALTFYKNGASQGVAYAASTAQKYAFAVSGAQGIGTVNFGQRPFAYTPPGGFTALHTGNMPAPSIIRGDAWFDAKLDTGANIKATAEATFTGNELVWIKDRANVNNHQLIDSVRGSSAVLQCNTTAAETTYTAPSGSSVGWVWKEGATPGFDIVTFTGTGSVLTVAHGLGVAPAMYIVKSRSTTSGFAGEWNVYHRSIGATGALIMNSTAATTTNSAYWSNTAPTSSSFYLGGYYSNTLNYVAYLFSEVAGFSKFGSYIGNGSEDGPFLHCGFRPRWVMIKRADTPGSWQIFDAVRGTTNVLRPVLFANATDAEANDSNRQLDFLSNGFKPRQGAPVIDEFNASGGTYVFAAFAENPFKYSLAR